MDIREGVLPTLPPLIPLLLVVVAPPPLPPVLDRCVTFVQGVVDSELKL